eukprot:GFUD01034911.1.p1 GENE.GFUD01034911.1~~GFUD01034911.1.p1  ORF type:complete len:408 (-),score=121.51 GFUD01034911.1:68-1291(-)
MAKRKSFEVSPGKGGIGHKIKKAKKPKNPLKGLGFRKITDFLSENVKITKPLKSEENLSAKSERKTLGEVGNIFHKNNPIVNIVKLKSEVDMEIKEEKLNAEYEEKDTEVVLDINELKDDPEIKKEKLGAMQEGKDTKIVSEIDELKDDPEIKKDELGANQDEKDSEVVLEIDELEDDPEMEGLCEYEKIRFRNIRERQAMFAKLEIKEAKNLCSPASAKPQKPQKRVLRPKENIEPRKSRRIAGGVPEINRFSASFDDHPLDKDLVSRPRRSLPENYNDYLHATRTFTGDERPDGLVEVTEGRFKILQVPKKCTIKQFVLSNNLAFKCGRGFYEFSKPEIISHRKEVVLIEKSSGKMFTGRDACRMIGAGSGIRIPPTTFESWRVFVQSTSYGRNLMGGTGFLYEV